MLKIIRKFNINLLKNYSLVLSSFFLACSPEDKSDNMYDSERKSLFEIVEENGVPFEEEDIDKIKIFLDTLAVSDDIQETIVEHFMDDSEDFPDEKFSFDDVLEICSDIVVDSWWKKSAESNIPHYSNLNSKCNALCRILISFIFDKFYDSLEKNTLIDDLKKATDNFFSDKQKSDEAIKKCFLTF